MTKYQFESVSIDEVADTRSRATYHTTVALAAMLPRISTRSRYRLLDQLRDPFVHGAILFTSSSNDHRGRIQLFGPGCSIATPEYATYNILGNLRLLWRKPCFPTLLPLYCNACNFYGVALDFPTVLPPYCDSPVQMCPLCFAFLHSGPLSGPPKTPPVSRSYLQDAVTEGFSWPSVRMTAMQDRRSWSTILKR